MKVAGQHYRTIYPVQDGAAVEVIDQTRLPHEFATVRLSRLDDAVRAIADMIVRGAPLIGATGAYGMALALRADATTAALEEARRRLVAARPTAVNLRWAVDEVLSAVAPLPVAERAAAAFQCAAELCDEDVASCASIGEYGKQILGELAKQHPGRPINVLTHCNAGWLATVDYGTALAPIYKAHDAGIAVHVWVDETRPRNQGASLTAWELGQHGVPHTAIADNAGGHLMQHGRVDVCIVGSDRTTARGDVCNKVGTYLKALAAHDCGVPFYAALTGPTIDWEIDDGLAQIPIEERGADEVRWVRGRTAQGAVVSVDILPASSQAANPAFDVTPARLVTGLITERGVCPATAEGLRRLYPEK
ncbi:MAG: S-methyl-5-thioribose-1-phosphate isomerase [Deltaproteobacteria bacterium]|nr:S-methyl-5-thioribose-1-phosphate isomerase [Deltaproteobacteria bacterium]